MAFIECEFRHFSETRIKIDNYLNTFGSQMARADIMVKGLASTWEGKDSAEFQKLWEKYNLGDKSIDEQIKTSLKSFSHFLRDAEVMYRESQSMAYQYTRYCNNF